MCSNSTVSTDDSTDCVSPRRGTNQRLSVSMSNQGNRAPALALTAESSSTAANCGCRSRYNHGTCDSGGMDSSSCGPSPVSRRRPKSTDQRRKKRPAGGGRTDCIKSRTAPGYQMGCCVQQAAEQAKRMHVKGADCKRGNPYATLKADTFGKLLKTTGVKKGARGRKAQPGKPVNKRIKRSKPKVDKCDGILQLCPHLGEGHTHAKLIEEVTPVLLRAAQNLKCQLREICRRLFFMKHNVPQLTAPTLINFHAILAEITRMLIADFSSFPAGLKLPVRG